MDMSGTSWISEMGLEDSSYSDQYDILDFFDEDLSAAIANIGEEDMHLNSSWSQDLMNNNSSPSNNTILIPRSNSTTSLATSSPSILFDAQNIVGGLDETPQYCHNNLDMMNNLINAESSINTATVAVTAFTPSPSILVFGNSKEPAQADGVANEVLFTSGGSYVNLEEAAKRAQTATKKSTRTRPPSQTYDHIIAERKRREQLSQQFVALSTIVPGLKKMDKTSVLGDAINYLKQLQEKVKSLEEKASNQKMESMVLVKKTQVLIEEEGGSSINNSDDDEQGGGGTYDEQHLPNIEAKVCDKKVLLRIQCEKNKGVLGKIFSVIQMLNMGVINTNVTPFGNMALDITIVAQLDTELKNLTMKELVKSLRSALLLE